MANTCRKSQGKSVIKKGYWSSSLFQDDFKGNVSKLPLLFLAKSITKNSRSCPSRAKAKINTAQAGSLLHSREQSLQEVLLFYFCYLKKPKQPTKQPTKHYFLKRLQSYLEPTAELCLGETTLLCGLYTNYSNTSLGENPKGHSKGNLLSVHSQILCP